MVGVSGNRWTDPGRLWEIDLQGGVAATSGHVLSQNGDNQNDQQSVTGERYFVYMR